MTALIRNTMLTVVVCTAAYIAVAQTPSLTADRTAQWHQDFQALTVSFSSGQKDFGKLYPQFRDEIGALDQAEPCRY